MKSEDLAGTPAIACGATPTASAGACRETYAATAVAAPKLLTVKEAATRLGYSGPKTLYNLRSRGLGPRETRLPTGAVRYAEDDLTEWVSQTSSLAPHSLTWDALKRKKQKERRAQRDRERYLERKAVTRAKASPRLQYKSSVS